MALTQEDLATLGAFIDQKVSEAVASAPPPAVQPQTNDEPQNQPENQPDYYVHLSNGKVIVTKDSQSTHMTDPDTGETCVVAGRFPKEVQ